LSIALAGRYRLEREVGQGGMATDWRRRAISTWPSHRGSRGIWIRW
jgi:hypothetical protein